MSTRTTQVRSPQGVIRRLRALADEVDRAVRAAARVREEIQRTFAAAQLSSVVTNKAR
jgi:hypothetical protein